MQGSGILRTPEGPLHGAAQRGRLERELVGLFDTPAAGVHYAAPDGRILRVNRTQLRLLGFRRREYLGLRLPELHADPAEGESFLGRLRSGESLRGCAARLRCKDGSIRHVLVDSKPLRRGGRLVYSRCFMRDVTQHRRDEQRLAAQSAVSQALAESATLAEAAPGIIRGLCEGLGWECGALWELDPRERVLRCAEFWHGAWERAAPLGEASRQLAFPPGADLPGRALLAGKPVWVLDAVREPDLVRAASAGRCGLRAAVAFPIRFEDNTLGAIELFSAEGRRPEADVLATLSCVGCNVGQFMARKRAEEELSLSEQQLRQAQKMEAVGRLAGGVAHDFNNLLTAILGHCKFLADSLRADDPRHEDLKGIAEASNRAAALTHQLLVFSRRQVLAPAVLNLNPVVQSVEKMLRRIIGEDVDLRVSLDPGLDNVRADPGQITQVLMNLALNARDALPRGGKVTIQTGSALLREEYPGHHDLIPPGAYAVISVSDNGCGMDADTMSRIFEPFFTTKEQDRGTGLGLSTVYGIVKQSGGFLRVHSEPGWGSCFQVYLPSCLDRADGPKIEPSRQAERLRGTERILVVEDDPLLRQVLVRLLGNNGYAVQESRDGIEAAQILVQPGQDIDLVLTDLVMPGLGGRDLADRSSSVRPQVKVIFMSGYTDDALIRHGRLDPGMTFLQKPVAAETLLEAVRRALDG